MKNINIKAILGVSPCQKPKPHFFTITRGATAELRYDLSSKWFSFKDLAQLTFTFKQNKKLYWFNMFDYLALSTDTTVVEGKVYYENISPIVEDSKQCTATIVSTPTGNPSTAGYYEIVEPTDHQNDFYYMLDEHFYHEIVDEDHEYISFILSSKETKMFKPTSGEPSLLFETTVKINTDADQELALHDSVIVEPHPSIVVNDCLYSQLN